VDVCAGCNGRETATRRESLRNRGFVTDRRRRAASVRAECRRRSGEPRIFLRAWKVSTVMQIPLRARADWPASRRDAAAERYKAAFYK
jgi:hypothetical protein